MWKTKAGLPAIINIYLCNMGKVWPKEQKSLYCFFFLHFPIERQTLVKFCSKTYGREVWTCIFREWKHLKKKLSHSWCLTQEETSPVLSLLRMPLYCCLSIPGREVSHSGPAGLVSRCHRYLPSLVLLSPITLCRNPVCLIQGKVFCYKEKHEGIGLGDTEL